MIRMNLGLEKAIAVLEERRQELLIQIKVGQGNDSSEIDLKRQLERAIQCLSLCQEYGILPEQVRAIIALPSMHTGYSEFRIMNDCETEQREGWIEVSNNQVPIPAQAGDLLVMKK